MYVFFSISLLKKSMDRKEFLVSPTGSCPKNKPKWLERSIALNCNDTNGYMCMPNEQFTVLFEFCYTKPKIPIPEGKRATVFNIVIIML